MPPSKPYSTFLKSWVWALVLVMSVITVWLRLSIVQWTYDSSEAQRTLSALKQSYEQTELQLTRLKSPKYLQMLAKSKFNLSAPPPNRVMVIEVEKGE